MTRHDEFQAEVVKLATMCNWRHLHVRKSIGKNKTWVTTTNLKGWPDCQFMRPDIGYVPAELKIPPDKATPEQQELLTYLGTLPATFPKLWTPDDWDDIETTLTVRWKRGRR